MAHESETKLLLEPNVMNHTPGPWRVTPRSNRMIDVLHDVRTPGAITHALCRVQARDSWIAEAEANARLVAAAPDMLAALVMLVAGDEDQCLDDEMFDAARAAIAKAVGDV